MTRTRSSVFVFLLALGVISAAWAFELVGGFQPCALCLQQRIPYYVGVPLAALAVLFAWRSMPFVWVKVALAAVAVVFIISLFLAVRHAGVEWDWWLGPANCGAGDLENFGSGGSLLKQLEEVTIAYCDEPAGRFLGLSFAGWNAIASAMIAGLALRGFFASK